MNIFAVDDDPNIIALLSTILAGDGFHKVQCFLSAKNGLAALRKQHPAFDCLILDIDMPEMNGIDLCRQVRQLPNYKDVPIIMLTALRDTETVRAAIDAGATDYITKPFDVLEIGVRIRMSSKLVAAQRALSDMRHAAQPAEARVSKRSSNVTRDEIKNLFAEELYQSKKA